MTKKTDKLTRNQNLVHETLAGAGAPLSAYMILDRLRDKGLRTPPQIYRALGALCEKGIVHRLDTLNSYVACRSSKKHRGAMIFAICNRCGDVLELTDETVGAQLSHSVAAHAFIMDTAKLEVQGCCNRCANTD